VSIMTIGLNRGIDFTGGRNYVVRFEAPVNTSEMEAALQPSFEGANVRVITIGSSNQVRITTNYKVEEDGENVEQEIRDKFNTALSAYMTSGTNIDSYIQSSQKVGPSIADDLKTAAFTAVIFAIICMALYILIRFRDIAFSVGTLVAVAHDALVVIFFYSFLWKVMPFSMEIDQTFIAAILTVVGYSINDKVVIFDRVRETRTLYPQRDLYSTINDSLNSTLGRTVNTTLSSMLVVFCIFILGGDTIRSFSFAMLLGIFLGSYSSLFIATPIAYLMLKRKKVEIAKTK
ncbi:MAG TPA: protein translocase subunit SecF, partial [Dysgonomonas sp.]|nr:protein translocase subunit SecF [Dysgonomonas sp.]